MTPETAIKGKVLDDFFPCGWIQGPNGTVHGVMWTEELVRLNPSFIHKYPPSLRSWIVDQNEDGTFASQHQVEVHSDGDTLRFHYEHDASGIVKVHPNGESLTIECAIGGHPPLHPSLKTVSFALDVPTKQSTTPPLG